MPLVLALLTLTLAVPPSGEPSRMSVEASANFTYLSLSSPEEPGAPAAEGHTVQGGGSFSATFYLGRPVVDDDAPLSLQPFLQRASEIDIALGGSGFSLSSPRFDRTGSDGFVSVGISGYATRRLYLGADFAVAFDNWQDTPAGSPPDVTRSELSLPFDVSIGGRKGDVLVNFGWAASPTRGDDGTWSLPYWGDVFIRGRALIAPNWWLDAEADAIHGGASGYVEMEQFFDRQMGAYLRLFGGHGSETSTRAPFNFGGLAIGGVVWLSRHLGGALSYEGTWNRVDDPDAHSYLQHSLTFAVWSRI